MTKVAIIGAGVSGMSCARLLKKNPSFDVTIFERNSVVGGIARPRLVDGIPYHVTGGHCMNSKFPKVLDFVFEIYPREKWNLIERKSEIYFKGNYVNYPIEFSLRQIAEFDSNFATQALLDLCAPTIIKPKNLDEWFRSQFGNALAESYFIPYNKKIWFEDPKRMSFEWVQDKLPVPNKKAIVDSIFSYQVDSMPHSTFFYPKSGGQASFLDALSEGLDIKLSTPVSSIVKIEEKYCVKGELYDHVILTTPLNNISDLINDLPASCLEASKHLRYNKVTTMLWEGSSTPQTWTYHPSDDSIFHRHIHIGNFLSPATGHIITEAVGFYSEDEMVSAGHVFPHLGKPIDYHVSDHAYVVFDDSYSESRSTVLREIESRKGLSVLGRFGEWEYFNMDVCIHSAFKLVDELRETYGS